MSQNAKIAIVGVGGVFPGADDLTHFWNNIQAGLDAAQQPPKGRWLLPLEDAYSADDVEDDKVASKRGCFLKQEGYEHQPPPPSIKIDSALWPELDPLFKITLQAGAQAFADAQMENVDLARTGVILGNIALPTEKASKLARAYLGRTHEEKVLAAHFKSEQNSTSTTAPHPINRYVAGLPGGLLAKGLGLGGGCVTLDAACASSLYALKLAIDELVAGRSDAMLAGGVSRPDCLYTQMGFSQLRAVSKSGRCAPFDEKADGLLVGEGAGIFILKRMEDAIAQQDHIYALICGVGLSNDIHGSLLSPSSEGQLRAMRTAYQNAGWAPQSVDLIECHGTGTPTGDAVEFESMKTLWTDSPTEINSSDKTQLPARTDQRCIVGSVKSNVGHLLTGAGAAGLMKILFSMKNQVLPPTANFETPNKKIGMSDSPFTVLAEAEPWKARKPGQPRRAALSAFGFGGINAHILLEEAPDAATLKLAKETPGVARTTSSTPDSEPIAIIGLDAHVGPWNSLQRFQARVLGGGPNIQPTPPDNWWGITQSEWFQEQGLTPEAFSGFFIKELAVSLTQFRIPPKELEEMLPQQLLMLKVTDGALKDAGNKKNNKGLVELGPDSGVFIGIELDLNTTNFQLRWALIEQARKWKAEQGLALSADEERTWLEALKTSVAPPLNANRTMGALGGIVASRIAREFKCGGPSFTLSSEECSGIRALEMAVRALQNHELNQALVGAVDLAGDPRIALANHLLKDKTSTPTPIGEGATALVLKRLSDAVKDGDRIYATIKGIGTSSDSDSHQNAQPSAQSFDATKTFNKGSFQRALQRSLADAQVEHTSLSYFELSQTPNTNGQVDENKALASIEFPRPPAVGCISNEIGHTGAASGLASLVRASLCLYQEIIPPLNHPVEPPPAEPCDTPLDAFAPDTILIPAGAQYWLRNKVEGPRRAGISTFAVGGSYAHVILEEHDHEKLDTSEALLEQIKIERRQPLGPDEGVLFVTEGQDIAALTQATKSLQEHLTQNNNQSLAELAQSWWRKNPNRPDLELGMAFTGTHLKDLLEEIQTNLKGLETDGLRHVSRTPMGRSATRLDTATCFFAPQPFRNDGTLAFIYPGSGNHFKGMGRALGARWPELVRRLEKHNARLKDQFAPELIWNDSATYPQKLRARDFLFGQTSVGALATDLMRKLGIKPAKVVGYSLGETAGLFGMRIWDHRDEMLERLQDTSLFISDLAEPWNAARRAWKLDPDEEMQWTVGLVNVPPEGVREALTDHPRAYLLIINTPKECVIGGDSKHVQAVVKKLGCHFYQVEDLTMAHCPAVKEVAKAYRDLHLFHVDPPEGIQVYSGAKGTSYIPTRDTCADAVIGHVTQTIDYPKLVEQAYADGARIFLELGPGASCSRMISTILADKPHRALSISYNAQSSGMDKNHKMYVLWALGTLIAERVPVSLEPLYGRKTAIQLRAEIQPPMESIKASERLQINIGGAPFEIPALPQPKKAIKPKQETKPEAPQHITPEPRTPEKTHTMPAASTPTRTPATVGHATSNPRPMTTTTTRTAPQVPSTAPIATATQPTLATRAMETEHARSEAHEQFLRFSEDMTQTMASNITLQMTLSNGYTEAATPAVMAPVDESSLPQINNVSQLAPATPAQPPPPPQNVALNREQCMEFAIGSIGKVLGPKFAAIDAHPTRVRLPDEPLMLVDRIMEIEGEALSMTKGRVVTEHDVYESRWYLDKAASEVAPRIPTCVAVEAGQADLFLSGYLGIDFETKGNAVYRLLDAEVTFHRSLPVPGDVIRYDIYIDEFFRQGETYLFRFHFESTVNGEPLLSMAKGCAGFFTQKELDSGQGVIHTALDLRPIPGILPEDWKPLVPMKKESYSDAQIEALRAGDLAGCFGEAFNNLPLSNPLRLPGGKMHLMDRVLDVDPTGGRYGLGCIKAEADIHGDDWFLVCHFSDDQVMPGTLMYECCMHTLRVYLLRMGWVADRDLPNQPPIAYEPIPGIASQLKCRGQVTDTTKKVMYQISIKELGYRPEPYAIADALMFADGKAIVEIPNMTVQLTGLTRERIESVWNQTGATVAPTSDLAPAQTTSQPAEPQTQVPYDQQPAIYDYESILAFSDGNPSDAFGEPYKIFDNDRRIARLPRPPYQFLDRVTMVEAEAWKMQAGGVIEAQYDVPPDEWYFKENPGQSMPFAILLEIALQPCGWLAAYMGSALTSDTDLKFRNLGGKATQLLAVTPQTGTLTTRIKSTNASNSGGMIIQHYDMEVRAQAGVVYKGTTYFGFFSEKALEHQVGIRDAKLYAPDENEKARGQLRSGSLDFAYPEASPFPGPQMRMLNNVEMYIPDGGSKGLGFIQGGLDVDEAAWFFQAHFKQDPVCPGSMGLESFLQLLFVAARDRWGADCLLQAMTLNSPHTWVYRGQVIPKDKRVTVRAEITEVDEQKRTLKADGFLEVDGRIIYQMKDFEIGVV